MKNVLSTGITSSSQQPYTKTTHEWYNEMSKDVAEAFVKSLIPSSAYTGKLVILSGCVLTGTNPGARTVSDGWVWYNGEIFRVNAGTFTTGVGEIGVWSINTASTNLTFSDGASKPVHQEKTLVFSNGEPGSGMFDEGSSDVFTYDKWDTDYNNLLNTPISFAGATVTNHYAEFRRRGNICEFQIDMDINITDYTQWTTGSNGSRKISNTSRINSNYTCFNYPDSYKYVGNGQCFNSSSILFMGNCYAVLDTSATYTDIRIAVEVPFIVVNGQILSVRLQGYYKLL